MDYSRRLLRLAVAAAVAVLVVAGAVAQGADSFLQARRTAFCPKVAAGPVVDGKLDDPCWKQAVPQDYFFLHGNPGLARGKTEVFCVRDDGAIYIAYKCYVDDLNKRRSREKRRDGRVWTDDSVELFLLPAPEPAGKFRFQFIFNTLGTIFDSRSDQRSREWTANLKLALGEERLDGDAGYWAVELGIPFADLTVTPKEGDVWRINFCRTSSQFGETTTWMPILQGGFDQPDLFGTLVMRSPNDAELASLAAYVKQLNAARKPTGKGQSAIPVPADGMLHIKKIPVEDCRVLRAFVGDPVDGTPRSMPYVGFTPREYPRAGVGAGISYHYNRNDGLHVTLADDEGFDTVVMRRFAKTKMYADATHMAKPGNGKLLWTFHGTGDLQVATFEERVPTHRISFFETTGGQVADLAFYRREKATETPQTGETWSLGNQEIRLPKPTSTYDVGSIVMGMEERFDKKDRRTLPMKAGGSAVPVTLDAGRAAHFVSDPFSEEKGVAAVALEAKALNVKLPFHLTLIVNDPLNPRRNLVYLPFEIAKADTMRLVLDVPDQILPKGSRLWITILCDQKVTLTGPTGGAPSLSISSISREQALPEALAYRKFLLRTIFGPVSEPRPWGRWKGKMTREEFFAAYSYTERLPELFMTIDQCHALDPTDDLSRQYREWVYYRRIKQSRVQLPPKPAFGAPDWAWYPRLAWLEARRIVDWWMEERLVPTGEVGVGGIQDDGDLYQQFADMPFFETGGVARKVLDCGARIAELCERDHLKGGLNVHATDSLHAYEEGINHLAIMARWFYGDPIYLERCMVSARNMEKLTVVTKDGRRHFRSGARMGYDDIKHPRKPEVDGGSTALMWHTALQAADYNHNPLALKVLREWADSWLKYMKPPNFATAIEVETGKVVSSSKGRPLYGGYTSQGVTFAWLFALTGDKRYVEPFLYYYRQGKANYPAYKFLGDICATGGLGDLNAKARESLAASTMEGALALKGDPAPLIRQTIGSPTHSSASVNNLCDARRFPDMYTISNQYTDRVLLGMLQGYASIAYLGGYCKRNKYNPAHAVSWEGFGTEFGAMVLRNRRDGFKLAAYNFSTTALTGHLRVWNLEHGEYRVVIGIDDDRDFKIDRPIRNQTSELLRADRIALELRPEVVTLVEVSQARKLDPIYARPDLAIAAREVDLKDNTLTGTLHNIGSGKVTDVQVAVIDRYGKQIVRKALGGLEAPLDLVPRHKAFTLALPQGDRKGWRLVLDPDGVVPEIYEGNNTVALDELPAVDYRKGWE